MNFKNLPLPGQLSFSALLLCFLLTINNTFATTWTTTGAGTIYTLTNWTNGSTAPTTFATPGDTWVISHHMLLDVATSWDLGTAGSAPVTLQFAPGGALKSDGISTPPWAYIHVYGDVIFNGGLYESGPSISTFMYIHRHLVINSGSITNISGTGDTHIFVDSNFTMTGGDVTSTGSWTSTTAIMATNITLSGGSINSAGTGHTTDIFTQKNLSVSGSFAMTNSSGPANISKLTVGSSPGTDTSYIANTSTGTWSGTDIFIQSYYAELVGNFSTNCGTSPYSVTLKPGAKLFCPAAYSVNGTGDFNVGSLATLAIASPSGLNGAVTTTGTRTYDLNANFEFNGTAPQVTGSDFPVTTLGTYSTLTVHNATGLTLSNDVASDGTLAFLSGILYTGVHSITLPGVSTAVTGAGLSTFVHGSLIKSTYGMSVLNFEVGDADYAPLQLTPYSVDYTPGAAMRVTVTFGLHPDAANSQLSPAAMVRHYWTVYNYGFSGSYRVAPKATYSAADILGGSNAGFKAQVYTAGSRWLYTPDNAANTSAPYTSEMLSDFIDGASMPVDIIYGALCTGTPISGTADVCQGATTTLAHTLTGGTWSAAFPWVATVSSTGTVTGVSTGTSVISYATPGCLVITTVTVDPVPGAGTITGKDSVCEASFIYLADPAFATWSSGNTAVATVNPYGVVKGIAAGTCTISVTSTTAHCGTDIATHDVTVLSAYDCDHLAVQENQLSVTELKVTPNPSSGRFSVLLSSPLADDVQLIITDVTGRQVQTIATKTNLQTDVVLNRPAGLYLLTATVADKRYTAKIVVE